MAPREYALRLIRRTRAGERLVTDRNFRTIAKAVLSLIFNLLFSFYNGILGILSTSVIFTVSAVYYLLLGAMRFAVVIFVKRGDERGEQLGAALIGSMLIVLSVILHVMVIVSMSQQTATIHGTIPMIAIATFTFSKITAAAVTAVKHRKNHSVLIRAINSIRYSEVAVSLLTMQQSMLVSFGSGTAKSAIILNALTGAAVCCFTLALGIITHRKSRKEPQPWQNPN